MKWIITWGKKIKTLPLIYMTEIECIKDEKKIISRSFPKWNTMMSQWTSRSNNPKGIVHMDWRDWRKYK